ncbi:MAG: fluoride efflux transporter CrcB [Chitinophagales bacterium]|nr:fluoride efflux transporter CrcB [Sphingobacteriales bacterium]
MQNFLYVFLGSGVGGCIRYALSLLLNKYNFILPIYTLISNVLACFILGITMNYLIQHNENNQLKLLIAIGICGGMSTYSTFSYEVLQQINSGAWGQVLLYSIGKFTLCLVAIVLGTKISF